MPVSAVCISYASGADGEGIGHEVARALGFRYVDEEILLTAAQQEGLEPEQLEAIEQRRSGLARLQVDVLTGGGLDEILRSLIRRSVAETAAAGEVVIVAHAASIALAADESVLRVLVTAPPEVRAKRLADAEDLDEREAGRRIEGSDKGRAAYFQQFYGIDRELPHHYDLVVNTERLSPERAVALVLEAAAPLDS